MSNIKKVFIISSVILFIALLLLSFNFFKPSAKSPSTPENNLDNENKPPIEAVPISNSKIISTSDGAVISPLLTKDGKYIYYYEKATGKSFRVGIDGNEKTVIADKENIGLKEALWSENQANVITEISSPNGEIQFFYHNFDKNTEVPIKSNLDNVAWQLSSNRIFYKYFDPVTKKRTLNTADPDGSNWKKLTDLSYRSITIAQIPGSSAVSFWNKADAFTETSLESMPISGGGKRVLFSDKFGADYLWNNDGQWLLVSHSDVQNGARMQLAIINQNGGEYRNLDFPTFVSKCVWSKDNAFLFCALPEGMPEKAILPNDYDEDKFSTVDTFWKIDAKTGEKSKIEIFDDTNQRFDAKNLFPDSQEKFLFFVNKIDGKLYRITL